MKRGWLFGLSAIVALAMCVTSPSIKGHIAAALAPAQEPIPQSGLQHAMARLVHWNLPINDRDKDGRTPLATASDAATAKWLIDNGANVNAAAADGETVLMQQAAVGNTEIVSLLIAAGAKLDAVNGTLKTTALEQALDCQKLDVAEILRKAGAHDDTVTSRNGAPVTAGSPPVRACLDSLSADQRGRTSTGEARPIDATLAAGFANDDAATVSMRARCEDGIYRTFTYQLAGQQGTWRVTHERWESRLDSRNP